MFTHIWSTLAINTWFATVNQFPDLTLLITESYCSTTTTTTSDNAVVFRWSWSAKQSKSKFRSTAVMGNYSKLSWSAAKYPSTGQQIRRVQTHGPKHPAPAGQGAINVCQLSLVAESISLSLSLSCLVAITTLISSCLPDKQLTL
jgi:hypothetical protein